MDLFILRHGIAEVSASNALASQSPDEARALTAEGSEKMRSAALGIRAMLGQVDLILCSPLTRTVQTAEIVSKALNCESHLKKSNTLKPGCDPTSLASELLGYNNLDSVIIVGHQPDLTFLASFLLKSSHPIIEYKKGSMSNIFVPKLLSSQPGVLRWHMTSRQLRAIGQGQ